MLHVFVCAQSIAACRKGTNNKYDFKFDRVFSPEASQAEVFEDISQLVQVTAIYLLAWSLLTLNREANASFTVCLFILRN